MAETGPTHWQRDRWFEKLVELAPAEALVDDDGNATDDQEMAAGVLQLQSDPGTGHTSRQDCDRYALFQEGDWTTGHDRCIYTSDRDSLERDIAYRATEGEGWTLMHVYDLETGEEVEYEIVARIKEK